MTITSREMITEVAKRHGWRGAEITHRCSQFTKGKTTISVDWSTDGRVLHAEHLRFDQEGLPVTKQVRPKSKRSQVIVWLVLEGTE